MYLRHYGVNFNYGGKINYGVEINYGITAFTIYGFLLRRYGTCRNRKNNSASTYIFIKLAYIVIKTVVINLVIVKTKKKHH
jgi:hypothetical protein